MALSLVYWLSGREENPQHLKQDQDCFIEVRRAIFECLTIEITEIAQAFVLFETYELVSFQILVVAHREELLLILELRKLLLGFSWLRYD